MGARGQWPARLLFLISVLISGMVSLKRKACFGAFLALPLCIACGGKGVSGDSDTTRIIGPSSGANQEGEAAGARRAEEQPDPTEPSALAEPTGGSGPDGALSLGGEFCAQYLELWDWGAQRTESDCYSCTHHYTSDGCPEPDRERCAAGTACIERHCLCTPDKPASDYSTCVESSYPDDLCACIANCFPAEETTCIEQWRERMQCQLETCPAVCDF